MLADGARLLDHGETRGAWLVVAQDMQRVFAGVETALTGLDLAIVRVALADFVLVAPALELAVKALVGQDNRWRGWRCLFPCSHLRSPCSLQWVH